MGRRWWAVGALRAVSMSVAAAGRAPGGDRAESEPLEGTLPPPPAGATPRPRPELWRTAGRNLLARLIAEFSYEELLRPDPVPDAVGPNREEVAVGRGGPAAYRLSLGEVTYTFTASRGSFGSWWPDPATLARESRRHDRSGRYRSPADDPARFVLDAAGLLGWTDDVTADVIRELTATQAADVRLLADARDAARLADASYTELEGFAAGHPCMVANKGRLGFGVDDVERYTPEARTPLRLLWVAVHPDLATFAATAPDPSAARQLLAAELDTFTRVAFAAVLATRLAITDADTATSDANTAGGGGGGSGDPDEIDPEDHRDRGHGPADPPGGRLTAQDYVWLPVHPWQWENVIAPLFASEIQTGRLVFLGEGPDRYLPLQSVRTLTNIDRPSRLNVKLALMIRNTLVWRGLSTRDVLAGPDTSAWIVAIRDGDEFLRDITRIVPLPEIAGASVTHPAYGSLPHAPYRLHELLGVLWRQPVENMISPDERARTFASLLLVGSDGRALVEELVARSGRTPLEWLRELVACLLPPLLHYLYVYGIAFTPHGENVIIVFDSDDVPTRIAVKDFGADIELVDLRHGGGGPEPARDDDRDYYAAVRVGLPQSCARHLRRWPPPALAHSVLSAVCAGHFRFFAVLAEDHLGVPENEFWALVRDVIETYHRGFPQYADRFAMFGLLAPTFERVCLNREQLAGTGFHERPDRDGGFDVMHGQVPNPLHLVASMSGSVATATGTTERPG